MSAMPEHLAPGISSELLARAKEAKQGLPTAESLQIKRSPEEHLAISMGERLMAQEWAKYERVDEKDRAAYRSALSEFQQQLLYCANIAHGMFRDPPFEGEEKGRKLPIIEGVPGELMYGNRTNPAELCTEAENAIGYVAKDAQGHDVPGYCFALSNEGQSFMKLIHVDARTTSQLALIHCLSNEGVLTDAMIAGLPPEQQALVRVMRKKAEGNPADSTDLKLIKDKTPRIRGVLNKANIEAAKNGTPVKDPAAITLEVNAAPAADQSEKRRLLEAEAAEANSKKAALQGLIDAYKDNPEASDLTVIFEKLWGYHKAGIDGEIAAEEAKITAIDAKLAVTGITEADKTKLSSDKSKLEEKVALIKKEKATGFSGASTLIARMMQEGNLSPETVKAVQDMLEAQPSDTRAFMEVMKRAGDEAAQVEMDRVLTVNKLDSEEVQEEKKGWSKLGKLLLAGGGILAALLALSVFEAASGGNGGRGMDDIMRMVTMMMGGHEYRSPEDQRMFEEWVRAHKPGAHTKPAGQAPQAPAQAKGHP